jgi:hypothetical protein
MSCAQGCQWRVLSASVQNAERRRLLQPQRKHAALRLPDSIATAAWPASAESAVAGAAVADLGQQLGGGDHGAFEQREEDLPVGMLADRGRDPRTRARSGC